MTKMVWLVVLLPPLWAFFQKLFHKKSVHGMPKNSDKKGLNRKNKTCSKIEQAVLRMNKFQKLSDIKGKWERLEYYENRKKDLTNRKNMI